MRMEYTPKRTLLKHQENCIKASINKRAFAFLIDMGGGKTKTTIDTVGILYTANKIDKWLCIAPNGIYKNWPNLEIPKDLPDYIPYRMQVWKEKDPRINAGNRLRILDILVINIEALSTKKGQDYVKKFVNERTIVTVDESTTIKNPKAKRTQTILEIGKQAGYRRILSGYPTPQNQLDLFSQFNFLDSNILGIRSFYAFKNEYAQLKRVDLGPGRPKFDKVVGPKNIEQLKEKISPYSFRIRKDECLDLPPKVYQIREVEMGEDQEAAYKDMARAALVELDSGGLVTADLVLTQLTRLHQITCGFMKDVEGNIHRFKKNPKIEALKQVLEETSDKVIVWASYVDNIKEIYDELSNTDTAWGGSVVTYYGGTSQRDRERAIESFQQGIVESSLVTHLLQDLELHSQLHQQLSTSPIPTTLSIAFSLRIEHTELVSQSLLPMSI
jgi:SNF2 family DNA or RNA helicase